MKIDELCAYAEDNGWDSLRFKFTNLNNQVINCQWLDAYAGLFRVEGENSFITVRQWKRETGDIFDFEIIKEDEKT